MNGKRKVEIFSAGCPVCREAEDLVRRMSCSSCEVRVLDMKDETVANKVRELGICSVPAVVVNGKVADCCAGRGPRRGDPPGGRDRETDFVNPR